MKKLSCADTQQVCGRFSKQSKSLLVSNTEQATAVCRLMETKNGKQVKDVVFLWQ